MTDNKLIICELSNYAPPFYGNFMASLLDLEKKLHEKNPDNKVIYTYYENSMECNWIKEMQDNNKIIVFLKNKYLKGFLQLKRIIKNYNINIIHSHFTIPVFLFFLLKLSFPKLIIISHFHNLFSGIYDSKTFKRKLKTKTKLFLYNKKIINIFCGCGEAVYNDLVNCGIKNMKCRYIDNCIDFSRLDKMKAVGKHDIINDKKVIMIYGSFFYTKGVDIAINAIKDIADKHKIILMIVCQNKENILKEIDNILCYIPDWIIIKPSQENIAEYFKMSSIYLIPSREEGFPYTMLESIYCDTLTIRSDIPSTDRELPNDFVVPVNNSNALRQCIESVLSLSENEKKEIISKQKNYIMQKWNIDIWSNNIINMYQNLLDNGNLNN